jgi:hypothetical protein
MSDHFAPALVEGVRLLTSLERDRLRYTQRPSKALPSVTPSPTEEYLPNVKLNNYVNREIVEDTHVLVVEHKEYLEKLAVPPTDEELAQAREEKKFLAKIWAGVAAISVVVVGTTIVIVERSNRKPVTIAVPE